MSTAYLFASDTICQKDVHFMQDQHQLRQELDALASWEEQWKMNFHPQKCSTLHMTGG